MRLPGYKYACISLIFRSRYQYLDSYPVVSSNNLYESSYFPLPSYSSTLDSNLKTYYPIYSKYYPNLFKIIQQ